MKEFFCTCNSNKNNKIHQQLISPVISKSDHVTASVTSNILGWTQLNISLFQPYEQYYKKIILIIRIQKQLQKSKCYKQQDSVRDKNPINKFYRSNTPLRIAAQYKYITIQELQA